MGENMLRLSDIWEEKLLISVSKQARDANSLNIFHILNKIHIYSHSRVTYKVGYPQWDFSFALHVLLKGQFNVLQNSWKWKREELGSQKTSQLDVKISVARGRSNARNSVPSLNILISNKVN